MKKLALLTAITATSLSVFAQGSVYTYQGRLNEDGGPANGIYDL